MELYRRLYLPAPLWSHKSRTFPEALPFPPLCISVIRPGCKILMWGKWHQSSVSQKRCCAAAQSLLAVSLLINSTPPHTHRDSCVFIMPLCFIYDCSWAWGFLAPHLSFSFFLEVTFSSFCLVNTWIWRLIETTEKKTLINSRWTF